MYSFSCLEPVCCSMSSSNCSFFTCIQISQEAGQVVWYFHLFKNFPQFVVIDIVKGFGVVNKAKVDVFLELSCFFHDPADVGLHWHHSDQFSHVWLFATTWITASQASLSVTNYRSSLKLKSIESVMPYSHLILCCPLLLLPPIPPSIRVFSNESTLCIRWPKSWSFSFSIIPSKEIPGQSSFRMEWRKKEQLHLLFWISLQSKGLSRVFSNTTV